MSGPSAIVVGGGPSGWAAAHRLTTHGVQVTLVDPDPTRRWRATYAAWTDEIPAWVSKGAIAARTESVSAYAYRRHEIARGYSVFDSAALATSLRTDEVRVVAGKVTSLYPGFVGTDDGLVRYADHVIDCRGATLRGGPRQTAYGVVLSTTDAARVLNGSPAILMDWRPPRRNEPWRHNGGPATFLYAVPVGSDEVLLEETCLVGKPAMRIRELADRLSTRLDAAGLAQARIRRTETVSFPVTPATAKPWQCRPVRFGAAGGFVNPVSGYGIAAGLRWADTLARAISDGEDPAELLWPFSARQVWRLRLRGLSVLLRLDPVQTVTFFSAFLSLPVAAQRSYLSERTDLAGTMAAMRSVFAAVDRRTRSRIIREVTLPGWT